MGIAAVARDFAEDLESGRVVALIDDWKLPPLDIVSLYPAGHLDLPKVQLLLEFLAERWALIDS